MKKNKLLIPIMTALGLVPMLVHMYTYQTGLSQFDWFPDISESATDFFLFWKMVALIILGVIIAAIMLYQYLNAKRAFRFDWIYYLLFAYLLLVIMSALFSPYKQWVVKGMYELMEPVWVLITYVLLCYYSYNMVRTEEQLKTVFRFSFIGVGIILLIGALQAVGLDPINTTLGKLTILNPSSWSRLDEITLAPKGITYTTLYNQDYVIFFVGLLLPVFVALIPGAKKMYQKILLGIFCVLSLFCLYGSQSTTAWIALVAALAVAVLVLLSKNKKHFTIAVASCAVIVIAGTVFFLTGSAAEGIRNSVFGTYKTNVDFGIQSIETNEDITIVYKGTPIHFTFDADAEAGTLALSCTDKDGNDISPSTSADGESNNLYSDGASATYEVTPSYIGSDQIGIVITIDEAQWAFVKGDDGTYYYYNSAGKCVRFPDMEICELFNEDALNGRGHIWNKTIPLLIKHLLVGSGANTYLLECPQDDYLYRNYISLNNMFDVKPHCWYLQQWVENGFLALLCLLAFYGCYMVQSIRLYRKVSLKTEINRIGFAIFVGTMIYMISALANDTTVNVAPIYWVMMGLGISVNQLVRQQAERPADK